MMRFYQWFKQKKDEGRFLTLAEECQWVWGYVWRYRGSVLIHILLSMSGIVMSLLSAIASKLLIDAVIGFDSGALGFAVAMTLSVRLAGIAMNVVATRVGAAIGVRIQHETQRELFHRILTTDWESLEQFRSGDLLNRIGSDASSVSGAVTGFIPTLLSSTVQFIGVFMIILYYDPVMALITLIGVPITALASRFLLRKMCDHSRELKELYSDVISFQQEALQNITSVKSFGVMDNFDKSVHRVQDRYKTENLRLTNHSATDEQLIEALKIACAYDFVMDFPEGLSHVIGGRDKRLSEGQAQRLAVARALLRGTPILLLDEAASALDMELEERLLENLMNSGMVKTCILVTRRPAGKKLCSRQYYIQNGIVKEEAVPQEQIREAVR